MVDLLVAQGVLSVFQGESFRQAFWSGALGSLGASGFQAVAGKFAKSTIGTIAFGALSGGIGAELSDGNFWERAVIGGVVAGLNHGLHKMNNEYTIDRELKKAGIDPNKIPKMGDLNQVKKMLEKVPSLKNLNNLSGNTTDFKFSPSLEDYAVTPNSGKGNVFYLGKLAFSTNRTLAIMVGHELMHVYHNYSGLRAQWNKSYGSMNGKYISEFLAHSWSNSMLNMTNAYSSSDLKNYFYNKIKHLKF